ncbi:MAG: hypothetical protein JXP34_08915 [Planctomycetes bacterium]|nr:hypothetical protein [Planctomycetota bacterium]
MIDDELLRKARAARERLLRASERAQKEIEKAEEVLAALGLGKAVWIPIGPRVLRGGEPSGGADEVCLGYSDEGDGRWALKIGVRPAGGHAPARRTRVVRGLSPAEQATILAGVRSLIERALAEAETLADALERKQNAPAQPPGADP